MRKIHIIDARLICDAYDTICLQQVKWIGLSFRFRLCVLKFDLWNTMSLVDTNFECHPRVVKFSEIGSPSETTYGKGSSISIAVVITCQNQFNNYTSDDHSTWSLIMCYVNDYVLTFRCDTKLFIAGRLVVNWIECCANEDDEKLLIIAMGWLMVWIFIFLSQSWNGFALKLTNRSIRNELMIHE